MCMFSVEYFCQVFSFDNWHKGNIWRKGFLILACSLIIFLPFIFYFNFFKNTKKNKEILGVNFGGLHLSNVHISNFSNRDLANNKTNNINQTYNTDLDSKMVFKDFIFNPIVAKDSKRIIGGVMHGQCFFGVTIPKSENIDYENHRRLWFTIPLREKDKSYIRGREFAKKTIGQIGGVCIKKMFEDSMVLNENMFSEDMPGLVNRALYVNSVRAGRSVACLFEDNEQDKLRGLLSERLEIFHMPSLQAKREILGESSVYADRCAVNDKYGKKIVVGNIKNFEGVFVAHGICAVANGDIIDCKTLVQKSFGPLVSAARNNYNLNIIVPLDYSNMDEKKRSSINYVDFELSRNKLALKPFVIFNNGKKEYVNVAIGNGLAAQSFDARDEILRQLYELNLACKESFLIKEMQEEFYESICATRMFC